MASFRTAHAFQLAIFAKREVKPQLICYESILIPVEGSSPSTLRTSCSPMMSASISRKHLDDAILANAAQSIPQRHLWML